MSDRSASASALERLFHLLDLLALRRLGASGLPPTLTAAAWRGDLQSVELFLAQGASLDEETIGCRSPLAGAVRSGSLALVSRLLAAGAKAGSPGAAEEAAGRGRIDMTELLFEAGLDPASPQAQNAFTDAAIAGKAQTMRALLARGVRVSPSTARFAAGLADANGYVQIAAFLRGERDGLEDLPDAEPRPSFIQVRHRETEEDSWADDRIENDALAIVGSGAIDGAFMQTSARGLSPLGAAIDAHSVAVANALLDRGADPHWSGANRVDDREEPFDAPLVMAAASGLAPLVHRLAAAARDADRDAAVVRAAGFGLPVLVDTLLEAGADPSFVTEGGDSALSIASGPYRDEIRRLLRRALRLRGIAPGPALATEGPRPRKRVAPLRGVRELVQSQVDVHPDWCILAVRKPIADVTPALARVHGAAGVELDVARRGVQDAPDGTFVLQLAGHAWTLELRSLGFHRPDAFEEQSVARVSLELECDALLCIGSDTSGTFSATRYVRGACLDRIDWMFDDAARADAYVSSLDLFLPGCRIEPRGADVRLVLRRIDPSAVARLDYLVLEAFATIDPHAGLLRTR